MRKSVFIFFRNSLDVLMSVYECFDADVQRAYRVATSGCPLAVKMTHGKRL
jgi:hypothetical protein